MSADNIVVIKKETDGKFRGYHRSMSAYSEGQYDHIGPCMFCDGTGLDDKLIGGDGKCPSCEDGYYTPPEEDPIFEVDTIEAAIHAYNKWHQEMMDADDMGMFMVEYGYTFEGVEPNEETVKTLEKSDRGGDLHEVGSIEELTKELREYTDTDLLNFLQQLTNKAAYTGKVVCRDSSTGRGWRLHETHAYNAVSDVRQAIMNYMKDLDF